MTPNDKYMNRQDIVYSEIHDKHYLIVLRVAIISLALDTAMYWCTDIVKGHGEMKQEFKSKRCSPKDHCCYSSCRMGGAVVQVNRQAWRLALTQAEPPWDLRCRCLSCWEVLPGPCLRTCYWWQFIRWVAAPSWNEPSSCHWGHWVLWCPRGRALNTPGRAAWFGSRNPKLAHSDNPVPFWHFYNRTVLVATRVSILSRDMMFSEP